MGWSDIFTQDPSGSCVKNTLMGAGWNEGHPGGSPFSHSTDGSSAPAVCQALIQTLECSSDKTDQIPELVAHVPAGGDRQKAMHKRKLQVILARGTRLGVVQVLGSGETQVS